MDSIIFIEPKKGTNWIEQFQDINEEINIYRTIIVVNNPSSKNYLNFLLTKNGFSVRKTEDIPFISFEQFIKKKERILIVSYYDIKDNYHSFLEWVMDQHNLLVLENLTNQEEIFIKNMITESMKVGLLSIPYYIWRN